MRITFKSIKGQLLIYFFAKPLPDYSSAGRAGDCSIVKKSLGPWFDSGWSDTFFRRRTSLLFFHKGFGRGGRMCILLFLEHFFFGKGKWGEGEQQNKHLDLCLPSTTAKRTEAKNC